MKIELSGIADRLEHERMMLQDAEARLTNTLQESSAGRITGEVPR